MWPVDNWLGGLWNPVFIVSLSKHRTIPTFTPSLTLSRLASRLSLGLHHQEAHNWPQSSPWWLLCPLSSSGGPPTWPSTKNWRWCTMELRCYSWATSSATTFWMDSQRLNPATVLHLSEIHASEMWIHCFIQSSAKVKQHWQQENIMCSNPMTLSDPSISPPNRISTISKPKKSSGRCRPHLAQTNAALIDLAKKGNCVSQPKLVWTKMARG